MLLKRLPGKPGAHVSRFRRQEEGRIMQYVDGARETGSCVKWMSRVEDIERQVPDLIDFPKPGRKRKLAP